MPCAHGTGGLPAVYKTLAFTEAQPVLSLLLHVQVCFLAS